MKYAYSSLSYDRPTASSKSQFSTQCDLVLPLSICKTLSFPAGFPVAVHVFFIVFL
jgi:hypothetical protein